jgi:outer membrane protein insertion porin family
MRLARATVRSAAALFLALAASLAGAAPAVAQQPPAIISAIVIEGNQRIEASSVQSYMQIGVGEPFDAERINQSLKSLFATGLFADVTIRRDGTALVVAVVENPIVNQVAFEGNRRIEDKALQAEVQLRPRVVYTRARVQSDVQRLLQVYRRVGRFSATIEPKIIQLPQNRVDVVFEINEGPITKVERISIVGNKRFTDARLREVLATKEDRWYRFLSSSDTYDPDRLSLDRELLRKFYLSKGFADFRIVSAIAELLQDRTGFYVTFSIEEGEIYKFGKIDIVSKLRDLTVDQLGAFAKVRTGATYDADQVEDTIQALTFEVGKLGYAFIDIKPRINRDREQRIIDVTFEIEEGRRVYVERIEITGNVRTLDRVIRREIALNEGDAFNAAKVRLARRQVRGLGYFDKVDIREEPGSAPDRTNILVNVQERSTGELSVGFGFSTQDAFVGDIGIRERNLLGKGQDLRLGLQVSNRRQEIDLSFTEPYFLDRNVAAGFDIFKVQRDLQQQSSYDENDIGFSLRTGFPVSENLRATLRYTLREREIEDVRAGASRFVREQQGARVTSSIGYSLVYDLRDDRIEPTKGYRFQFGQDFAGLGGDNHYVRTNSDYIYYFPLAPEYIASLGVKQGFIFGIGEDITIGDRFVVGGNSLRGFETAGIGPRDRATRDALGGNLFYVATAEVSFPLGLPNELGILGRVFTDVGSLSTIDGGGAGLVDKGSPRVSVGFGVSWRSPFGPIRLDYGIAVIKEDFDMTEAFRFSFGTRL